MIRSILSWAAVAASSSLVIGEGRGIDIVDDRIRPNFLFILADDAGIADVGAYHTHFSGRDPVVPTPNLDRLFREGMAFTDAQLPAALCAPNRFSILTGSFPFRSRTVGTWNRTATSAFHFGDRIDDRIDNPHRTVGSALQSAGYRTAYFGKMHFGGDFVNAGGEVLRNLAHEELGKIDFSQRFRNGLLDHGFDYTFVAPDGIQGPLYLWFENDLYRPVSDFADEIPEVAPGPDSVLRTFAEGDRVGRGEMIQKGYGDSRFDTSEHGPIMGHFATRFIDSHLSDYPDKPFLLFYATPAIHEPLTPEAALEGASGLDLRADFVMDLDRQVGRLLEALDRHGITDNTLIIFTSDNGAGIKGGEEMIAAGQDPNGPFRGVKGTIYEGGHRVPFMWRWGDGTPEGSHIAPGVVSNQLVSVLDWVPTVIALAGGELPEDQHLDATSLLPFLGSPAPDQMPPLRRWHWYRGDVYRPRYGVRMDDEEGKWKLIFPTDRSAMELYNLQADISQTTNLAEGFHNPEALPDTHPHAERIHTMQHWFREHFRTHASRTIPITQTGDRP